MHILEQYALNCGLKIGKPFIHEKYFPLPLEKYITFNPFGKFNSRKYSYWQDVIDLLSPILSKENIGIVQIGGKDEIAYNNCLPLMGQTNFNQTAYIINNSLLHFGVDSFPIHMASYFDKKIVALYCNMYAQQSKPYWSSPQNIKLIQANLNGKKPSYAAEENPKTINNIKPEEIVYSILELLNIKNNISQETIFIGDKYGSLLLESIPSVILPPNLFPNVVLNIRYDYINEIKEDDYICTLNNLNIRNCCIITDKPIDINRFAQIKDKISNIFYDISSNKIDVNFINSVKFLGIKIDFIFKKSNESNDIDLNNKKLELIEYPEQINIIENSNNIEMIKDSTFYKSKKLLFASNNVYLSKAAYIENKPVQLTGDINVYQKLSEINNLELLIENDSEYCLFFK
ncbi:glycosyltransferase family 9 protein [Hyphomonas sp.]|jgi:hypothetical protein|uniref:glycosyltransferase family 9 protein n=1 Tax=Hyphomonas sp. TaxID=87 RepID=UPI0037C16890